MTFERTFDYELIRSIVTDPQIYAFMVSDGGPRREDWRPPDPRWSWYVLVRDRNEVLGLFWLVPYHAVCWEVHTLLLPHARGKRAIQAYREGVQWVWRNTPCKKLLGNIPEDNRPALAVALRGGLKIIGRNTKSILRYGRLIDQTIVGIGIED